LEPKGFFTVQDQADDLSIDNGMNVIPTDIATAEFRLARLSIKREDPLLATRILEIADVDLGVVGANNRRIPATGRVAIVYTQKWI
jgi:hypothetical protein